MVLYVETGYTQDVVLLKTHGRSFVSVMEYKQSATQRDLS